MDHFFLCSGVAHVDNVITRQCSKQSQGCSCQGCRTGTFWNLRSPAPRTTFRNLPPEPTPPHTGTLGNLGEHTFRKIPEPVSGTYPLEPILELSGTFRNLPPEPAPATRTGTHRSLSGLKTPLAYAVGEKASKH